MRAHKRFHKRKGMFLSVNTLECGLYFEANKEEVFAEWEELANKKLQAASDAPDLIVRNYLPYFLASLVEALKNFEPDPDNLDTSGIDKIDLRAKYSDEHGRARASVSSYDVSQVIQEYSLLRQVLRNHLYRNGILCLTTAEIINRFIEANCAQACQKFSNSIREVQEKLISVIAHDLRNPISVARSYVEVGELGLASQTKVFSVIKRSLGKALGLIGELLDASQLKAGEGMTFRFEEKDLVKELKVAAEEATEVYSNRVNFETNLEQAHAVCDHMSVLRVVENLISNAIKYGGVGRPITIGLRREEKILQISVHNEGSYIEPTMRDKMFDFLSRDDTEKNRSKEGWGIGLYIVRLVAKAHKGKAWIESDKSAGTTFYFTISTHSNNAGTAFSEYL